MEKKDTFYGLVRQMPELRELLQEYKLYKGIERDTDISREVQEACVKQREIIEEAMINVATLYV